MACGREIGASGSLSGGEQEVVARRDKGAGRGKKDRPARRKRKVVIGDEVYWASEAELPALLQTLLTQPEAPPATPREARKRARRRAKAPEAIPVAKIAEVAPQRRPEALARLFEAVGEDILLRSLQIAVANLAEQDDEEVLLLTL